MSNTGDNSLAGYIQYWCWYGRGRSHDITEDVPQVFFRLRANAKARRQLLPTINELNERLPVTAYALWKSSQSGGRLVFSDLILSYDPEG